MQYKKQMKVLQYLLIKMPIKFIENKNKIKNKKDNKNV